MFKENMLKDEKLENVTKEPEIEKKILYSRPKVGIL